MRVRSRITVKRSGYTCAHHLLNVRQTEEYRGLSSKRTESWVKGFHYPPGLSGSAGTTRRAYVEYEAGGTVPSFTRLSWVSVPGASVRHLYAASCRCVQIPQSPVPTALGWLRPVACA